MAVEVIADSLHDALPDREHDWDLGGGVFKCENKFVKTHAFSVDDRM